MTDFQPGVGPKIRELITAVGKETPLHRDFMDRSLSQLTDEELERFETFLEFCEHRGKTLGYVATCYLTIVNDTLAEQMYFLRNKKYRASNYAEVADLVYHNKDYMDRYMYGLVVTAFLWPNHVEMGRFFREHLPRDRKGRYLEIGPGHGYYMMTAVAETQCEDFLGIDISEASINQTRAILDHFAPEASRRIELRLCDFLDASTLKPASFDIIVMGEVLEHVEQPDAFLRRIGELIRPDGFVFVTTCINAPAIDHIYLWRTTDSLEGMIRECGFEIRAPLRLPYEGRTMEQTVKQDLSINVAYVLAKV